jgi:hypothetical protein
MRSYCLGAAPVLTGEDYLESGLVQAISGFWGKIDDDEDRDCHGVCLRLMRAASGVHVMMVTGA